MSDIYQRLRKPESKLTIPDIYQEYIEEEYKSFKNFIIRLFNKKVNFINELGTITKLITLIKKTKYLSQWYHECKKIPS